MNTRIYIGAIWLAALQACSQSAEEVQATREQHLSRDAAERSAAAIAPSIASDAELVNAVSAGASTTPIALKFRLNGRPQVGQSVNVELVIFPDATVRITHMYVSVKGGDGLQLAGASSFDFTGAVLEDAIRRELSVQPQQPGVLNLTATVAVDTDTSSVTRIYSIPLIAEAPAP